MISHHTHLFTPYPYQKEAIEALLENRNISDRSLVVMASGLGKTITAALYILEELKEHSDLHVLFLCHDNNILEQCRDEFANVLGNQIELGLFHGGHKDFHEVTVLFASLQTMRQWRNAFMPDEFDIVIVDEGHHGQAATFRKTIEYFTPRHRIALTATPDRMDGKDIREIFGNEIYTLTLPEALRKGYLTWITYHPITDNLNRKALQKIYNEVMNDGRRITMHDLNQTIFVRPRDKRIAEIIRDYRPNDEQTIIFCPNVKYAEYLWSTFFSHDASLYHASLPPAVARMNYENFRSGVVRIIIAVDKFNEGIDIPEAELIVFLRSTKSKTIWLQQLGRGLRKKEGKNKVTVLDFVANCERIFDIRGILPHGPDRDEEPVVLDPALGEFLFSAETLQILQLLDRIFTPPYETIEEAMAAVRRQKISSYREYRQCFREDSRLPSRPEEFYANKGWKNWPHFLEKKVKNLYQTIQEAMSEVQWLKISTKKEYRDRHQEDPQLPAYPDEFYANKGWNTWSKFLGKDKHLKVKNPYTTLTEAMNAVLRLKFSSAEKYKDRHQEDPRLPSHPETFYKNKGWISWSHFLGRRPIEGIYGSILEAMTVACRLKISSKEEYKRRYKEDPRLPSNPDQFYKDKGWISWSHFLGKKET